MKRLFLSLCCALLFIFVSFAPLAASPVREVFLQVRTPGGAPVADQQAEVEIFLHRHDLVQFAQVALHAEYAFGDDELSLIHIFRSRSSGSR